MLPSGGVQLLFALHETPIACFSPATSAVKTEWSGAVVHGPQWRYYVSGPKPPGAVIGVAFRPGQAGAVLGVALPDLADQHAPLGALWGARGCELHEQLMAAHDPMQAFRILEQNLSARIERSLLVHPAVAHALSSCELTPASIGDLQREAGYSAKHFIALFRAGVGMTPKHYYRIQRFNRVLRYLASGIDCGLAGIAASAGYSDQAHLTREFRELAGVTPTQYRPSARDRPLHHTAGKKTSRR